jgi:hypothetical protein
MTLARQRTESPKLVHYLKIAVILTIIVALNIGGSWLEHLVNFQLFPRHDSMLRAIVLVALLVYVLLMATPFMPGIEIGLALMLMLGSKGILLVYLCTLVALSISFIVGKIIPAHLVYQFLNWLHLYKAGILVRQLEPLNQQERIMLLNEKAPSKLAPFLLKHRYLMIAIILNLPGNALIGGGGGIGLIAGMSNIVSFHAYIALLAIAIAPVPLLFFLQGI